MAGEITALKRRQIHAATEALEVLMDHVLGRAVDLAPVEEGTLRGSADRDTTIAGNTIVVVGSFSTVYAARQHEELDWNHPRGGQAKYLEAPFKETVPRVEPTVQLAVRAASL